MATVRILESVVHRAVIGTALAVAAACSDPVVVEEPFEIRISGPFELETQVVGISPNLVHECRFEIVARASGGVAGDRGWLNSPTAQLRLSSGATTQVEMLNGWEAQSITPGQEVRGRFYIAEDEWYDATLVANWMWMRDNIWMEDQATQWGNSLDVQCSSPAASPAAVELDDISVARGAGPTVVRPWRSRAIPR
jgi:hypothetical protein